jgi:hypothetical protein
MAFILDPRYIGDFTDHQPDFEGELFSYYSNSRGGRSAESRGSFNESYSNYRDFMHAQRSSNSLVYQRLMEGSLSPFSFWTDIGNKWNPELREIARRIFNLPASASGCERNWSTMGLFHTAKRNRLGPEKLRKMTFIKTNEKYVKELEENYYKQTSSRVRNQLIENDEEEDEMDNQEDSDCEIYSNGNEENSDNLDM